jgi:hypothetical protein
MFLEEVPMLTILLIHIALCLVAYGAGLVALCRRYVAEERAERALQANQPGVVMVRIGPGTYMRLEWLSSMILQFPTRLDGAEMIFAAHVVAFWEGFTGRKTRGLHA